MDIQFIQSFPLVAEITTVGMIATLIAVSPGPDFVAVTRNSLLYGRRAGLYSAFGIGLAIWVHVTYSIAGLAFIISESILLFSLLKYPGASYLVYTGWKTIRSKSPISIAASPQGGHRSGIFASFGNGFMTNALNPKTSIFFLSIFSQIATPQTNTAVLVVHGAVISLVHLIWFCIVAMFFSHPVFSRKFGEHKKTIERIVGSLLIGLGVRVATTQ